MATASPTQSTAGISPKAPAAGGAVAGTGLLASLVNLIAVGHFDTTSIILALSGSAGGLIAYAAAYIAKPGPVHTIIADAEAAVVAVEHADPKLTDEVKGFIRDELAKLPVALKPVEQAVEELIPPDIAQSLADPALDQTGYIDPAVQALLLSGGHTHLGDVPPPAAPVEPAPESAPVLAAPILPVA
jgi:hypothetical protein